MLDVLTCNIKQINNHEESYCNRFFFPRKRIVKFDTRKKRLKILIDIEKDAAFKGRIDIKRQNMMLVSLFL